MTNIREHGELDDDEHDRHDEYVNLVKHNMDAITGESPGFDDESGASCHITINEQCNGLYSCVI